ncbi:hypothetical protein [Vitreimonas flagellata]|uniref:hypothetical protein n=1 Tax=Vitreimonas flagellata TaxID=2560861 RepID=UPI001074A70C|nr:hypothetical protein [Vitreimonas flagellata]
MSALALPLLAFVLAWLVYTVTTYALPCLAGLAAARYAFETGSGLFGACVVFGLTAITVFGLIRWLFAVVEHPTARIMLSTAFVTPAVLSSYFFLESLSAGHIPSETWRQALCVLGASIAGLAAFGKLAAPEQA